MAEAVNVVVTARDICGNEKAFNFSVRTRLHTWSTYNVDSKLVYTLPTPGMSSADATWTDRGSTRHVYYRKPPTVNSDTGEILWDSSSYVGNLNVVEAFAKFRNFNGIPIQ